MNNTAMVTCSCMTFFKLLIFSFNGILDLSRSLALSLTCQHVLVPMAVISLSETDIQTRGHVR